MQNNSQQTPLQHQLHLEDQKENFNIGYNYDNPQDQDNKINQYNNSLNENKQLNQEIVIHDNKIEQTKDLNSFQNKNDVINVLNNNKKDQKNALESKTNQINIIEEKKNDSIDSKNDLKEIKSEQNNNSNQIQIEQTTNSQNNKKEPAKEEFIDNKNISQKELQQNTKQQLQNVDEVLLSKEQIKDKETIIKEQNQQNQQFDQNQQKINDISDKKQQSKDYEENKQKLQKQETQEDNIQNNQNISDKNQKENTLQDNQQTQENDQSKKTCFQQQQQTDNQAENHIIQKEKSSSQLKQFQDNQSQNTQQNRIINREQFLQFLNSNQEKLTNKLRIKDIKKQNEEYNKSIHQLGQKTNSRTLNQQKLRSITHSNKQQILNKSIQDAKLLPYIKKSEVFIIQKSSDINQTRILFVKKEWYNNKLFKIEIKEDYKIKNFIITLKGELKNDMRYSIIFSLNSGNLIFKEECKSDFHKLIERVKINEENNSINFVASKQFLANYKTYIVQQTHTDYNLFIIMNNDKFQIQKKYTNSNNISLINKNSISQQTENEFLNKNNQKKLNSQEQQQQSNNNNKNTNIINNTQNANESMQSEANSNDMLFYKDYNNKDSFMHKQRSYQENQFNKQIKSVNINNKQTNLVPIYSTQKVLNEHLIKEQNVDKFVYQLEPTRIMGKQTLEKVLNFIVKTSKSSAKSQSVIKTEKMLNVIDSYGRILQTNKIKPKPKHNQSQIQQNNVQSEVIELQNESKQEIQEQQQQLPEQVPQQVLNKNKTLQNDKANINLKVGMNFYISCINCQDNAIINLGVNDTNSQQYFDLGELKSQQKCPNCQEALDMEQIINIYFFQCLWKYQGKLFQEPVLITGMRGAKSDTKYVKFSDHQSNNKELEHFYIKCVELSEENEQYIKQFQFI